MTKTCKRGHSYAFKGRGCNVCHAEYMNEYYKKNHVKLRDQSNKRRKANPEIEKHWKLRTQFGISLDQYNEMLVFQKHSCALCLTHQDDLNLKLAVDHDHATGQIRGLLCGSCNTGLGLFKDSIFRLDAAIKYLGKLK